MQRYSSVCRVTILLIGKAAAAFAAWIFCEWKNPLQGLPIQLHSKSPTSVRIFFSRRQIPYHLNNRKLNKCRLHFNPSGKYEWLNGTPSNSGFNRKNEMQKNVWKIGFIYASRNLQCNCVLQSLSLSTVARDVKISYFTSTIHRALVLYLHCCNLQHCSIILDGNFVKRDSSDFIKIHSKFNRCCNKKCVVIVEQRSALIVGCWFNCGHWVWEFFFSSIFQKIKCFLARVTDHAICAASRL